MHFNSTSPRRRSRRSSIRTRGPTSSCRSARKASTSKRAIITFTALPGGLLTKVGKMRAAFGKVNTLHNHVLPWADRPLVTDNLVGGEDGIDDAGFSVARLIPNPWFFLEATGQVFRGDSGRRCSIRPSASELSATSATCAAITTSPRTTNIDLGVVCHAHGHNASGVVDGVDAPGRFTTAALRRRRHRSLEAAAAVDLPFVRRPHLNVIWSRREQPDWPAERRRVATSRATTSSRGAGLPARATTGPIAPTTLARSTRAVAAS